MYSDGYEDFCINLMQQALGLQGHYIDPLCECVELTNNAHRNNANDKMIFETPPSLLKDIRDDGKL